MFPSLRYFSSLPEMTSACPDISHPSLGWHLHVHNTHWLIRPENTVRRSVRIDKLWILTKIVDDLTNAPHYKRSWTTGGSSLRPVSTWQLCVKNNSVKRPSSTGVLVAQSVQHRRFNFYLELWNLFQRFLHPLPSTYHLHRSSIFHHWYKIEKAVFGTTFLFAVYLLRTLTGPL